MAISIYTDGSVLARRGHINDRKGGLGVVFVVNGKVKKIISIGYSNTNISRMELLAVLTALKILAKDQQATIYSDSMYAVNCFKKKWLKKWEKQNWEDISKEGGQRTNSDILVQLLEEYRKFPGWAIKFEHVKGHGTNKYNCLADKYASYRNFTEFTKDL